MADESEKQTRSFSSWKFEMLDAMSFDPELSGDVFRFAYRLLAHVNRETKLAWPALETVAAQMGIHRHTAGRHAQKLCDLGWIERERPNRRAGYHFRFLEGRICRILENMDDRNSKLNEDRERRFEVADLQRRESFEVANLHFRGSKSANFDVAELLPKHLQDNSVHRTPSDSAPEGSDSDPSYGTDQGRRANG
ncbi:MAG: helix-turn-helix domain-containing protein [Nitratireductor sp.]